MTARKSNGKTNGMKPPKCKSCGAEEWRHICRPSDPVPDFPKLQASMNAKAMRNVLSDAAAKFDRVAYQRDYMRRYRAKKTGK